MLCNLNFVNLRSRDEGRVEAVGRAYQCPMLQLLQTR